MDHDIPNGTVVRLRSGGPDMTVVTSYQEDYEDVQDIACVCVWIDSKFETHREAFRSLTLDIIEKPTDPYEL